MLQKKRRYARWLQRAALLVASCSLVGCARAHLYNPANHELAKKAEKSFQEAKLTESATAERELLEAFLQDELAMVRERVVVQRDHALMAILNHDQKEGSWTKFKDELIDGRMNKIGPEKDVNEILDLESDLEEDAVLVSANANVYRLLLREPGATGPKLLDPLNGFGKHRPEDIKPDSLKAAYDDYKNAFDTYQRSKSDLEVKYRGVEKGELGKVGREISAAEKDLQTIQEKREAWKSKYEKASDEYKKALKKTKEDQQALIEPAKNLRDLISKAEIPDAAKKAAAKIELNELGALIAGLETRQKSVQTLLDAFIKSAEGGNDAQTDDASEQSKRSEALVVASTLGALAKEIGEGLHYPRVTSLLLESEHLGLRLELAKAREARIKTRVALLRAKRAALVTEYDHLHVAKKALAKLENNFELPTGNKAQSLFDDFASASRDVKILIAHALINYANSWTLGRLPQRELTVRLIAERHAASLESSVNALKQWENLVGTPLTQLVTLHGSGITTEEIAAFINAAGLGAIAAGVN